jgi:hypothetical protein
VATWTPAADADVSIGTWAKETGAGTPIFGEVDEGIAAADSTGVKRTGEADLSFGLSNSPGDLVDAYTPQDPSLASWLSTTNGAADLNAVAFGNGKYVAVGASGALYWSSDGLSWTSNPQGSETLRGVAFDGTYWVAVGANGAVLYTTDPTGAWTSNTQGGTQFNSVAYGNGYWVAVGSSGVLRYRATDPTGAWTSNAQGSVAFASVAYGNGYWVAVGDATGSTSNLYYKATDPTGAWTSNAQDLFASVAYGNGYWVAVGKKGTNANRLYYATDPTGAWTSNAQGTSGFYGVAYGNGFWVALGFAGTLYYRATDPTGAWTSNAQGSTGLNSVVYGATWVGVGASGATITASSAIAPVTAATFQLRHKQSGRSDDGMTWNVRVRTSAGVVLAAANSGGTYQSVGADNAFRTTYGNNAAVSFGYVNTGASKAQWDDARVEFNFVRTTSMSADTITWFIDTFDFIVTYTAATTDRPGGFMAPLAVLQAVVRASRW